MLSKYFPDTCLVAEYEQKIAGFVSAFLPPQNPEVVFVWQIAVAGYVQKKGLGTMLLKELLKRKTCEKVRFLETTVTLSNVASQSLFCRLARDTRSRLEVTVCFPADLFPKGSHETEFLFRIGPLHRELKK
jgi:L-2,4-diaminobutyric acid acetyltransferase